MFNGDKECFCCPAEEDPPPCTPCEACTGEAPGDCADKVCESFTIEVEGFANTTTDLNCEGYTATGTDCEAYNGTFILEQTANPCIFRSDEFTATVPIYLEINYQPCYECENVAVYYELEFLLSVDGRASSQIKICKASDGIPFAIFSIASDSEVNPPFTIENSPPNASLCHHEGIEQAMSGPYWPPWLVQWSHSRPFPQQPTPFPAGIGGITVASIAGGVRNFIGEGDLYGMWGRRRYDQCKVDTEFDAFPEEGVQLARIISPHWVCCRDESWDCDFVRDEIAPGNYLHAKIPLLRLTSIRCGT